MKDGRVVKDNDEDGEHGAGRKLQHLLEMMQVENVVRARKVLFMR